MAAGPFIRRLFGRYERQIAEAYRSVYVSLDRFADQIQAWAPEAANILEVGCGEGAMTERIAARYPAAEITAIDISPAAGRLYRGPAERVRFVHTTAQRVAAAQPGSFDLVILADVLHHVPPALHGDLLAAIRTALAPDGRFVLKEWERRRSPIFWMGYLSDRFLTGDRVRFMTRAEIRERLGAAFPAAAVRSEARIRPWRSNYAALVHA